MMPVSVAAVTAASRVAELCPRGVSGRPVTVSVPRQLAAGRRAAALVRAPLVPLFADIIGPPSDGDDWRPSEGRPPPPPPAVSRRCLWRYTALDAAPLALLSDGRQSAAPRTVFWSDGSDRVCLSPAKEGFRAATGRRSPFSDRRSR